jgi:2,4-dienoyl-CoA reductase-like NADH-dependent reductase (Old Yellow Enzyme family)
MSPKGVGIRPHDMELICASSIPVELGNAWVDKKAVVALPGILREATHAEIDEVDKAFNIGARVAREAGFKEVQIHAAHGFLISQLLSPYTNRRTDEYGGLSQKRLKLLQRVVKAIRDECPAPLYLCVKLNSGDLMPKGGLTAEEGL